MKIFKRLKLKIILKKIDKNSVIDKFFSIKNGKYIELSQNIYIGKYSRLECYDQYKGNKYNPTIVIKENVKIENNFTCLSAGEVFIDSDTLIAGHVLITNENHCIDNPDIPYRNQKLNVKNVYIGKNVWIGEKVCILPGVNIGNNSIIGAGSIVNKDIPEYSIAVGNPARVIKKYDMERKEWIRS